VPKGPELLATPILIAGDTGHSNSEPYKDVNTTTLQKFITLGYIPACLMPSFGMTDGTRFSLIEMVGMMRMAKSLAVLSCIFAVTAMGLFTGFVANHNPLLLGTSGFHLLLACAAFVRSWFLRNRSARAKQYLITLGAFLDAAEIVPDAEFGSREKSWVANYTQEEFLRFATHSILNRLQKKTGLQREYTDHADKLEKAALGVDIKLSTGTLWEKAQRTAFGIHQAGEELDRAAAREAK
jgi:hypothetical protein